MPIKHKIINISNTQASLSNWNMLRSECSMIIKNISAGNVYVGGDGVTTNDYGFRMLPEQTLSVTLGPYDEIYAISDSIAEVSVLVLEN